MSGEIEFNFPASEDAWEFELDMLQMFEDGLIEISGENDEGEPLIRVTDKGRRVYEAMRMDEEDGDK